MSKKILRHGTRYEKTTSESEKKKLKNVVIVHIKESEISFLKTISIMKNKQKEQKPFQ